MEEQHAVDDQSHYEISLTAGQAFIAFVLLLLSLAASFAFGLMLGKGQADERLVVQKETPVVTEASVMPSAKKELGEIVELGVDAGDFRQEDELDTAATPAVAAVTETAADTVAASVTTAAPVIIDTPEPAATPVRNAETAPAQTQPAASQPAAARAAAPVAASGPKVPHLAQLLSTGDQKTAEALAVRLIERGFTSAYVERGTTEKGPIFRVRVRFDSEQEARAAEHKLREFSKDVWITAR